MLCGSGPIWLGDIQCTGKEANLELCEHGPWGNTPSCDHSMDAGVCCQGPGKPPPKKVRAAEVLPPHARVHASTNVIACAPAEKVSVCAVSFFLCRYVGSRDQVAVRG